MNRFVDERKNKWQELEDLLNILETSTMRRLPRVQVRELGELYRRAAADLAIARAETRDPKLINYLNSLVIRAHGKIYRANGSGVKMVWKFFAEDFPRTFRKRMNYTITAFLLFTVFGIISFALCYYDRSFSEVLGLASVELDAKSGEKWWLDLNKANQVGSSAILTNNILVSLMAFAYGAFFGIGTIYVLISNGLAIGGVLGVCFRVDPMFGNALVTFMVGHGVIELSCIFIAGGAGLLIGYSIINPGNLSRADALKQSGLEAVRLAIGCACFLVIAGIIEGFLSPAPIAREIKYGTGILTGVAMYSYLFLAGNQTESESVS